MYRLFHVLLEMYMPIKIDIKIAAARITNAIFKQEVSLLQLKRSLETVNPFSYDTINNKQKKQLTKLLVQNLIYILIYTNTMYFIFQ